MPKSGAERTKAWRERKRMSEKKDKFKKQKKTRTEIERDSRERRKIRANLLLMGPMDILNDHENQTSTSTMTHPSNDNKLHVDDNLQYSELNKFKNARNIFKKDLVCCVCDRLLFKSDLKPLSVQNKEIIQQKFPEFNGQNDLVCNCCCQSLTRSIIPTLECESGGRYPSGSDAQLAVQKICNTVHQFGMTENIIEEQRSPALPLPQVKVEPKKQRVRSILKVISEKSGDTKEWHAICSPVPDIDLMMECHEELLSAVQAETILKAQMEYNTVMKRLRDLRASNAKITCINNDDEMTQSPVPTSPAPKATNIVTLCSATLANSNLITVVPVHLVTSQSQSNSIKQPGSPAEFRNIIAD